MMTNESWMMVDDMMNDECVFVDFGSTQEHQVGFGIYLNRKSNFN